jgi:hypothetical protein
LEGLKETTTAREVEAILEIDGSEDEIHGGWC